MEPEKVSSILDDLKNRFASRFIFSFTIAWLIFHWQISIALFWYDKSQFEAEGFKSVFDFIGYQLKMNSKNNETFWTAIIYTFGLPISKGLLNIWDEFILDLRNWSKTKLVRSQDAKTIRELKNNLNLISQANILNGNWNLNYYLKVYNNNRTTTTEDLKQIEIYISDRNYYVIENQSRKKKYQIVDFYFNPLNRDMMFKLQSDGTKSSKELSFFEKDAICTLRYSDGSSARLEGIQNNIRVEYIKI